MNKIANQYSVLILRIHTEIQNNPVLQYSIYLTIFYGILWYFQITPLSLNLIFSIKFIIPLASILSCSLISIKTIEIRQNSEVDISTLHPLRLEEQIAFTNDLKKSRTSELSPNHDHGNTTINNFKLLKEKNELGQKSEFNRSNYHQVILEKQRGLTNNSKKDRPSIILSNYDPEDILLDKFKSLNEKIAFKALKKFGSTNTDNSVESLIKLNLKDLSETQITFDFIEKSDCMRILIVLINTGIISKAKVEELCSLEFFKYGQKQFLSHSRRPYSIISSEDLKKYFSNYRNKKKFFQTRDKKLKATLEEFKITKDYFSRS